MKIIPIEYSIDHEKYFYTCPFCNHTTFCDGGEWDSCEHVIFGYEDINRRVLAFDEVLYHRFWEILLSKRVSFLDGLYESWTCDYQPEEKRSKDPEAWDEAKEACVENYLNEWLTLDDFKKILRCSELKPLLKGLVIAETEEDPAGWGKTSFVLSKESIDA